MKRLLFLLVLAFSLLTGVSAQDQTSLTGQLLTATDEPAVRSILSGAGFTAGEMDTHFSPDGKLVVNCYAEGGTLLSVSVKDLSAGDASWGVAHGVYTAYRTLLQDLFGEPQSVTETFIGSKPDNDTQRMELLRQSRCLYNCQYSVREGWSCSLSLFFEPGGGPAVFVTCTNDNYSY